jgi:hypothetical protein
MASETPWEEALQHICRHIWGYRHELLNRQRIRAGDKRYVSRICSSDQISWIWPGWPLSQALFFKGSREVVIAVFMLREQSVFQEMIPPAPGYSFIITGNCPHLESGLSYKAPPFLEGSFSPLSGRCYWLFLSFLNFKVARGENDSEQRTIGIN